MGEGIMLVVSGPSGCGKGTICKELLRRNEGINVSVSATTRKPRKGEVEGVNYFFVSENKFKSMIKSEEVLEYAHVHGSYYGTPKKFVFDKLESGEDILLEIDVQGAMQIKDKYPQAIFIFIIPPSMEELKNRIIKRGTESKDDIEIRFKNAFKELEYVNEYDYIVINDEVKEAVSKIECIVQAEKCKISRQAKIIENIL